MVCFRPQVPLDLSKIDPKNPDSILQMSKKGKTLMMFVTVAGNPSKKDLEQTTQLWQTSLFNAHFDVQRFVIDENRAIFMFKDGSQAWEAKEFLLAQDRCEEVTIEGKSYPGKAAKNNSRKKDNIKQPKGKEDL